jgi:3-deoxy-D-manno-octulosonic acid kinase
MREVETRWGDARILYDADIAAKLTGDWFQPGALAARGWLRGGAMGRGSVHYFCVDGRDYVLRHYRRGGRMAGLLADRYLWRGAERTRAWREWRMLARMCELCLPVPPPCAARVIRRGIFYRADLITARIPQASSLATCLKAGALSEDTWREIGGVIASFHAHGIWHADLNAHNVLLCARGHPALVDFDRARFRRPNRRWQEANLKRLLRSLRKLRRLDPQLQFHDRDFAYLRAGYEGRTGIVPQPAGDRT